MYQNKAEDRIVTPAHLLLLPLDSNGLVNYVNFKDVGLNTLNESSAFSAIRNATKIYNTNLVHTPTEFSSKYAYLNSAYVDENSFLTTSSFGVKKQHTSASMYALGNPSTTTILDTTSLNKFLSANMNVHQIVDSQANNYAQSPISLSRTGEQNSISGATRAMSLVQPNGSSVDLHEARLLTHPAFIEGINDNSDLAGLATPSAKLTAQNVNESILNNKASIFTQTSLEDPISYTTESSQLTRTNKSFSSKEFNLSGPNSKVLANDQSIRNFTGLTANKSNFNLTSGSNTVSSNKSFLSALNKPSTPALNASSNEAGNVDYVMFNTLASNRSLMTDSHPSVLSSHESESDSLGYDRGATYAAKSVTNRYGYSTLVETQKLNSNAVGDVFIGSREKTPQAINSAY